MISNGRYYVMYSGTHKYAVQLGERTLEGFRMLHVYPTASKKGGLRFRRGSSFS